MLLASCLAHAILVIGLTSSSVAAASAASPYKDNADSLPQANASENGWPPEPFRTPLTNHKDGYLVFRNYGPSGSAKDRNVLLALLGMVTEVNLLTPAGYPSPTIDLNIPETGVYLRSRGTTAPGFPPLSPKLALSTLRLLKALVPRYGAQQMFIDVHDGFLDYGPWGIMIQDMQLSSNLTDRVRGRPDSER